MATGVSLTDYSSRKLIDHLLGTTAFTMPTGCYLALFTVAPTDSTAGTEVSGGSYAREAVTWNAASGSPGNTANDAEITFTTATANWGTIVAVALMDAVSGGNMLAYASLTSSQVINSGATATFAIGSLTFTMD